MATKSVKVCDLCGAVEREDEDFEILAIGDQSSEVCAKCVEKVSALIVRIAHPKARKPRTPKA